MRVIRVIRVIRVLADIKVRRVLWPCIAGSENP